jgi:ribosomal protein S27AE
MSDTKRCPKCGSDNIIDNDGYLNKCGDCGFIWNEDD